MRLAFFQSLQGKLVVASVAMVLVVLALAGFAFVWMNRGQERERKLEHVTANATAIQTEFLLHQLRGEDQEELAHFVDQAASVYDVRALMVDATGVVVRDSAGVLDGQRLSLESAGARLRPFPGGPSYLTFQTTEGSPGSDLVLITSGRTPLPAGTITIIGGLQYFLRYNLLLAVSEQTLTRAWLDLLPTLGVAAGIAIPVAILLAIIVARYITRPLEQLTAASLEMASGTFNVHVSVQRQDEVGRLASAFTTMAQRVGEAQTRMRTLLANISHDMKTPLTSIIGFSQALRDDQPPASPDIRRMAAIIHEEAQRLNARLNDLLYLSEIESGQVVLQQDLIDLPALIRDAAERIRTEASARGITLQARLSPAQLVTDGQKLERIIENLLDNARKFSPEGGLITVACGAADETAWVEVANPAPDVAPEELPLLFDRFYRRDRNRSPGASLNGRGAGSGLGLPIARDLAALLGGALTARLQDGLITFRLQLPLALDLDQSTGRTAPNPG